MKWVIRRWLWTAIFAWRRFMDLLAILDGPTAHERAQAAVARHEAYVELLSTVARLTDEWNHSDRIDRLVRRARPRDYS